jgi:hypothetical protein
MGRSLAFQLRRQCNTIVRHHLPRKFTISTIIAAQELYHSNGWTDGYLWSR